jgi:hypothetical protein
VFQLLEEEAEMKEVNGREFLKASAAAASFVVAGDVLKGAAPWQRVP